VTEPSNCVLGMGYAPGVLYAKALIEPDFHVKAVNGQVELEQDDRCLCLPNTIETIPDARKALKTCAASHDGTNNMYRDRDWIRTE